MGKEGIPAFSQNVTVNHQKNILSYKFSGLDINVKKTKKFMDFDRLIINAGANASNISCNIENF